MAIKNILFDLGGVVLDIDPERTVAAFEALGLESVRENYNFPTQTGLFDRFEVGAISPAEFRDGLRSLFGKPLTDGQIDTAWNAMLLDFSPQRLAALEQVRRHYRCFLLSNTNDIHLEAYLAILRQNHQRPSLEYLFEALYYSQRVGLRKPDPAIFQLVIDQNGLEPAETLFIDDAAINLEGARQTGLRTYHLHIHNEELADLFDQGKLRSQTLERMA